MAQELKEIAVCRHADLTNTVVILMMIAAIVIIMIIIITIIAIAIVIISMHKNIISDNIHFCNSK